MHAPHLYRNLPPFLDVEVHNELVVHVRLITFCSKGEIFSSCMNTV